MKCARNRTTCARSVVQCYASGEVRCGIVLSVVISICVIELCVPVLLFHIVVLVLLVVVLNFISLVSRSHFFTHVFTVFSLHFRCSIYIICGDPPDGVRTSSPVLCGRNSRDGWTVSNLLQSKGNNERNIAVLSQESIACGYQRHIVRSDGE